MDSMFKELVTAIGMSTGLWATILLVGSQITSFAYPEADMMGQMGLARSKDLKNMVKFGITITAVTVIYVGIRQCSADECQKQKRGSEMADMTK